MKVQSCKYWVIVRKCPRTGFIERTTYTGSIRNKPKGWVIERSC